MTENVLFPIIITAAIVVFVVIARSKRVKQAQYDERQLLARNAAYKVSFIFLLLYCFACGFLQLWGVVWADIAIQMFLGIVLSFSLFIAICIVKDAYFSSSQKHNTHAVIFFFTYGVLALIYLLDGFGDGNPFWDQRGLSVLGLYSVASVCSFALGILAAVKMTMEKRGAEK